MWTFGNFIPVGSIKLLKTINDLLLVIKLIINAYNIGYSKCLFMVIFIQTVSVV